MVNKDLYYNNIRDYTIEDNERLIGVRSTLQNVSEGFAQHKGLNFVIGSDESAK